MTENESGAIDAIDNSNEVTEGQEVPEVAEENETGSEAEQGVNDDTPEDQPDEAPKVKKKRPSGFHRKISKLERQNAELQAKLDGIVGKSNGDEAKLDVAPIIEDYEAYDDYIGALTNYNVNIALKEQRNQSEAEAKQRKQQEAQQKAAESWGSKVDALDESYSDYEEVISEYSDYAVRPEIREALEESDIGPQLAYHLAKNPDKLDKLNAMPKFSFYKEMASIESSLAKPKVKKTSNAPAPIEPLKTSGSTSVDLSNLDTEAYLAQRLRRK